MYGLIRPAPVVQELCETYPLQRLKRIRQGGPIHLIYPQIQTTRFEHSLGVAHLVERLGGDLHEQVLGLLHDVSHTALSHLVDYVLENENEDYHEHHKARFILHTELAHALNKFGFDPHSFLKDCEVGIVEQSLPHLSADRVDYCLRDLLACGRITTAEARDFLETLILFEGRIVTNSIAAAKWFSRRFHELNEGFFRDPKCLRLNEELTLVIRYALEAGILSLEDFFEDDEFVLNRLFQSRDETVLKSRARLDDIAKSDDLSPPTSHLKMKFRRIDPTVLIDGRPRLLSEL